MAELPKALIWDVDGTIAETERDGHRVAFNKAFEAMGLPRYWDEPTYGRLLLVTGGRERLLHDMQDRPDAPHTNVGREALARLLHKRKNAYFAELVAQGAIGLRPGVQRLMDECLGAGVRMAVATTTSRSNVDALFGSLWGAGWRRLFAAVVCAEDAPAKKPDPQVYRMALQQLRLLPGEAFALEDSPNGLRAALGAGVACGVTRSAYFAHEQFGGAAWVQDDLETPDRMTLPRLRSG
jgi:HAD superfamily hydrolase (TIGR01509 family)